MNRSNQTTGEWLLGAAKQNPEGLLLLAAGACLLLRSNIGSSPPQPARHAGPRRSTGIQPNSIGANQKSSGASHIADEAQEYVSDVAGRAKETVASMTSAASDYTSKASRAVSEQTNVVMERAQSTFQGTVNSILQQQPLAIALAGAAAGAAIAAAFPATEFEREYLGSYGEQMTDAAERVGEQLKDATMKAGESLKTAAQDRGLSGEGLKEVASEVTGAFSDSMKRSGSAGDSTSSGSGGSDGSLGSGGLSGGPRSSSGSSGSSKQAWER